MRLALFSPWPPVRSGIADYARDLAAGLVNRHEVDIYVRSPEERADDAPPRVQRLDAHDFPWRHARSPYDLVIYQLGNSAWHDYMWPYLFRYPGLVVLHDGALHHARAASLLRRQRADDYRAELAFNHPGLPRQAAELAITGFDGPIYYDWTMLRAVVASARGVAVHNVRLADQLSAEFPGVSMNHLAMGIAAADSSAGRCGGDSGATRTAGRCVRDRRLRRCHAREANRPAAQGRRAWSADITRRSGSCWWDPSIAHFDVTAEARAAGVAGCAHGHRLRGRA